MAEVSGHKAVWCSVKQGAWGCWRCGQEEYSGTRGAGRGSGLSVDPVVQAEAGHPFCCQHDCSCLMLAGRCQPPFHLPLEVGHWPVGVQLEVVWISWVVVGLWAVHHTELCLVGIHGKA